jgi:hypothetical protein
MTEERVLNEAQISMGVSLPLHHKDVLRMFFVLVGRGLPVAEVIDILAEINDIKAPAKQQWEHILPERECPAKQQWECPAKQQWEHILPERECRGCGISFQPLSLKNTYHNVRCQQMASRRRQSDKTRQKHLDYVAALQAEALEAIPEAPTIST